MKRISTIKSTQNAIKTLGPSAKIIADCEGLDAHAESIQARLPSSEILPPVTDTAIAKVPASILSGGMI